MFTNLKQTIVAVCLFLILTASNVGFAIDGNSILKASDEALIPLICSYTLTVQTQDEDGQIKKQVTTGYKKMGDRNVMIVREPKRMGGSVHLRKKSVIWSYYTTNHKLMKVAYQSVFMGSMLNYGDVMALELSYDYNVESVKEENDNYILTLQPKPNHDGYAKVVVVITKSTLLPRKREYYALSGILLKVSEFTKIDFHDGHLFQMEQVFYEPLKDQKTVATYDNIKVLKDLPEKYFNENYIKYLSGE